jgi:hypothetical protein
MSQWLQVKYAGGITYIQVSHIHAIRPGDTQDYCVIVTQGTWYEVPHSVDSLINAVMGPGGMILIPAP